MIVLVIGFSLAVATLLVAASMLTAEEIIPLYAVLGLIAVIGTIPTIQWMQERRYRSLIDKGLGLAPKSKRGRFRQRQDRRMPGLFALLLAVAYLGYRHGAFAPAVTPASSTLQAQPAIAASTAKAPPPQDAPTETSAAAPPPAAAVSIEPPDQRLSVEKAIRAWVAAWASGEVDEYLAAYGPSFTPEDGLSRETWSDIRRKRISNAKDIAIEVDDLAIKTMDAFRAEAVFVQRYSARGFHQRSRKTLILDGSGGHWKIVSEHSEEI